MARLLSWLFALTILFSFVYIKIASVTFLLFIIIGSGLFFKNGNKLKIFVASVLLFCAVLSGFFYGIKTVSINENKINKTETQIESKNRDMRDRLIEIRLMIDNGGDEARLLSSVYDAIKIGEEVALGGNAESYLNLGYVYEIANALGIDSAKEKALENFAVYCRLEPNDKTCELVR